MDQNIQNDASGGSGNNLGLTEEEWKGLLAAKPNHTIPMSRAIKTAEQMLMPNGTNALRTSGLKSSSVRVFTSTEQGALSSVLF